MKETTETSVAKDGRSTEDGHTDPHRSSLHSAAESPWLTLENPCNPRIGNMSVAPQHRHWQNVYPKPVTSKEFKWASMCTPAALPLTNEHCPTIEELQSDYVSRSHSIVMGVQDGDFKNQNALRLVGGLVASRLTYGFQFIRRSLPETLSKSHHGPLAIPNINDQAVGPPETSIEIIMALGDTIHEILWQTDRDVEVNVHTRKIALDPVANSVFNTALQWRLHVRTPISHRYVMITHTRNPARRVLDWETIDSSRDVTHSGIQAAQGSWRARFVLIPVDLPRSSYGTKSRGRGLTDEERRLDAIQRLTQTWQKARQYSPEDKQYQASLHWKDVDPVKGQDANPLAIDYQTLDPSDVVHAYGVALTEQQHGDHAVHLFSESDMYHSSDFDVMKLAQHLQEATPRGVPMKDRRWYTKHHLNCFRGDEMTNWLLKNFKDVDSREEAVRLGDVLMNRGLFTHVVEKHDFRDGNYFYQIAVQYRTSEYPDTAGFFKRRAGKTVPWTPILQAVRDTPTPDRLEALRRTPTLTEVPFEALHVIKSERPKLELTRVLQYNLDASHKSSTEVMDLHYGKLS